MDKLTILEINDLINKYHLPLGHDAAHRLLLRFSYCALKKLYPDYAKQYLTRSIDDMWELEPMFSEGRFNEVFPMDGVEPSSLHELRANIYRAVMMGSDVDSIGEVIDITEPLERENVPSERILELYQECLPFVAEE